MNKLFAIFLLFISFNISAQKVDVSIAGGFAFSRTNIKSYGKYQQETNQLSNLTTYNAGLRFNVHLNKRFDFKTGIYVTQKGYIAGEIVTKINDYYYSLMPIDLQRRININYLDIPAMFSFHFFNILSFNTGVGLSLDINQFNFTSSNFDTPFLIGISYQKKRISWDILSSYGKVPFMTKSLTVKGITNYYDFYHRQFSVTLGYIINQKVAGCTSCKQKGF